MEHWWQNSIFYHIYPLGLCGAPFKNDNNNPQSSRLELLYRWIDHLQNLGVNALYLGPVFESSTHGYDTIDFFQVDKRLGDNETLLKLIEALHLKGIKVILDGVFHHVGRDFWAFLDLKEKQKESGFVDWFVNVDFNKKNHFNDNFSYDGWNGHYNLVKLNLKNIHVKEYLFKAVKFWIEEFNIDGLRLDAADCIDNDFLAELSIFCKTINPEFWLMGEVIHGDYRKWVNNNSLDSVTNYECYKGLYSSHNDKNYFEIAYSLNRQFGDKGMYENLLLYNFADNHDVDRVSSILTNPVNIYPLYCILFTMPGIPSIYYGSEWGIYGKKQKDHDYDLRPEIDLDLINYNSPHPDLVKTIKKLIKIRHNHISLKKGKYKQLCINHQQFAFIREFDNESIIVVVNSTDKPVTIEFNIPVQYNNSKLSDLLNDNEIFYVVNCKLKINIYPNWARILIVENVA